MFILQSNEQRESSSFNVPASGKWFKLAHGKLKRASAFFHVGQFQSEPNWWLRIEFNSILSFQRDLSAKKTNRLSSVVCWRVIKMQIIIAALIAHATLSLGGPDGADHDSTGLLLGHTRRGRLSALKFQLPRSDQ